ncbi:hypothetical protein ACNO7M_10350, partial [Bisgaard Taxon 45]
MTQQIVPPLAVHFIWHPDDNINSIIMSFRQYLTRDIDRPFSRELNIPTFLYSSQKPKQAPAYSPKKLAKKDVIFLFLSVNTLMIPSWKEYINSLPEQDDYHIIPVALEHEGTIHTSSGRLKNLNCLRLFDWPNELK